MQDIAVIFDIDGLMVDTEPISRQAWDRVLARYDYEMSDDLHVQITGYRFDASVVQVLQVYDLPLTAEEIKNIRAAEYAKILALGVPVMPGLYDLVAELERRDLPWAVATSSPYAHAVEILHQLGLSEACQAIAAGDEVPHGKPAPDIYLLAAKRLNVSPKLCMALEDSAPGCRAALAAGMLTVAVPNGDFTKVDYPDVHRTFNSLGEAAEVLDQLLLELDYHRRALR